DGTISARAKAPPTDLDANQTEFTFRFYQGGTNNPANLLGSVVTSEVPGDGIDNDGDGNIDEAEAFVNGPNPFTWTPVSAVNCTADPTNPVCQQYVSVVDLAPGFYTVEVQENISGQNCKV